MKIKSIHIKNIGLIVEEVINCDKPLLLFYGDIRQGKTTILNAVRIAFGGAFPADILRHGELEGHVKLETEDGFVILREFYRSDKAGEIKARPLTVQQDGKRLPKPVDFLKKFLNPFLLDGNYLADMPPEERKKYFVELFQIDTKELDNENGALALEAKELRATVKSYGSIDLTKVERVNVDALKARLAEVQLLNQREKVEFDAACAAQTEHNKLVSLKEAHVSAHRVAISDLRSQIDALTREIVSRENSITEHNAWLASNPRDTSTFEAEYKDTRDLEEKISDAKANNVRAEIYEGNVAKAAKRLAEEHKINQIEERQREITKAKAARLKQLSDDCGIEGLEFLDAGAFLFEGTTADMLSTSQVMKLSSLLSGLYPEGMGLELLDRAESLGKSVFGFVEQAKAGNKTILATIVGERPATVPDEIGVFIVEQGKITS